MKPNAALLFVATLLTSICSAQVVDNFDDDDFSNNPTWIGDDSLFQINTNKQLQSKGTAGTSKDISLATASQNIKNCEWKFWIRFNFSPSTQNFCRYYLTSNASNLKGNLNGYYIQFGGSTGSTDTISLNKQSGITRTIIVAGRPGTISKTNNVVEIKVTRDSIGNWELFSDTSANENYILEGKGFDSTFKTSYYSGIFARFTSSNVSNFYFDNLRIGEAETDTVAPILLSHFLLNDSSVQLNFNEKLEFTSAQNKLNFLLDSAEENPISALISLDEKSVVLTFSRAFVSPKNYFLICKNIKDKAGNTQTQNVINFLFFLPQKDDILINELMADPTPTSGLPDAEFVELFNRSKYTIDLTGWEIDDGNTTGMLSKILLKPDSFLILCSVTNKILFKSYGTTLPISSFPGLNNDGEILTLTDNKNNIVNRIRYDLSWYKSTSKQEGGFSLELINPYVLCKESDNWIGSESPIGGTPGKQNFYTQLFTDTIKPKIKSFDYTNSTQLRLVFNEKMDSVSVLNSIVSITNNTIINKTSIGTIADTLLLNLALPLIENQLYTLTLNAASDCSGNTIEANTQKTFTFIPIAEAKQNDVIITEVFPNPKAFSALPEAEYLELFNRSKNIVELKNWTLKNGSNLGIFGDIKIYPDSHLILCDDSKLILFAAYSNAFSLQNFPALSNDDDLVLIDKNGFVIHQLHYKNTWYNDNVKAASAYSLEMIDTRNPCGQSENWSASNSNLGGTPGKTNSIKGLSKDNKKVQLIRIYPTTNQTLDLFFDETLDSLTSCKGKNFITEPAILGATKFNFKNDALTQMELIFSDSFKVNQLYKIKVDSVYDCANNLIDDNNIFSFALTKQADTSDVVINEILYNPRTGGIDFVEIYNKKNEFIDLKNLFIANRDASGMIADFHPIADSGYMLLPNEYYAITSDKKILEQQYFVRNPKQIIETNAFPSFNDDEGSALIFSKPSRIYDELLYDEKMHFPLLDMKDGVSLERIDFNRPTSDRSNWTSASQTSGFATPTCRNSQFLRSEKSEDVLTIQPEIFSPDGDGYNDIVNFNYRLEEVENIGKLIIFNSKGFVINQLMNNTILGTEGTISWNGLSDKNEQLPIGIYIVYFEVFNKNGDIKSYKKTLVLTSKI